MRFTETKLARPTCPSPLARRHFAITWAALPVFGLSLLLGRFRARAEAVDQALDHDPDPNRAATCPARLGEMIGLLTDRQVMRLYGFAENLLCPFDTD